MQRVDLRRRSVRAIVAVLAASALLTAGSGSTQSAGAAVAHVCPPIC